MSAGTGWVVEKWKNEALTALHQRSNVGLEKFTDDNYGDNDKLQMLPE
jgi:hypothetical protein